MPKQTRKPADPSTGSVAQFGYDLRMLRQHAKKSYAEIANNTYYSKSAVHGVDQGHQLPTRQLLMAFVKECGGDVEALLARRVEIAEEIKAAKQSPRKATPRELGMAPPDPTEATTPAEFNDALKRLREWSGHTFRDIAKITKDYPRPAPASTLCNAFARGTLPARDLIESFLRAVDVDDTGQATWLQVWQALHDGKPVRSLAWRRWRTGAQPAIAQRPQDAAGEPPLAPTVPYTPADEIRDWVFVNGRWQATGEDKHTVASWLRRALASLPPNTTRVTAQVGATAVVMILILLAFALSM
jgi:transcriptional regulator with XRE-family HTH domain